MTEPNEFLAEIARLYYINQCSQTEIAAKFSVSRLTISRLLKEARDRNIVEIKIIEPWARVREIEYELKKQFPLQEVRVLARRNRDDTEVKSCRGWGY